MTGTAQKQPQCKQGWRLREEEVDDPPNTYINELRGDIRTRTSKNIGQLTKNRDQYRKRRSGEGAVSRD